MLKKILAATAAASLTVAPIAAQANTRAADAGVSIEMSERMAARIGESEEAGLKIPLALIILLFGAGAAAIIALIEDNGGEVVGPPVSPGA
ncbi:hypothetical protein [Aurantiacibacter zhengii]|uniref:Ferrochelatase n=1 Tax=Aurantiacibacter zhengii TaxID=2307003 RepID=A0A418NN63_9SPHN|nr:hypothetical protein [Aurantiacibacter zhengii]RIV83058.1 hypothetical protein D2V07_17200 [Aurantiacibacter zhengii]